MFGLFVFSGALYAALAPANTVVGGIALAVGISTLFAIDMVYGVLPLVDHRSPHSAGALLTGLLFAGAWLGSPILVGVFVTVKLVLYLRRKTHFAKSGRNARTGLSVLRVVSGFFAPTLVWVVFGADWYVLVLASLLLGEIVDRVEFYLELETVNPESQMAVDLRKELATTLR